jgi:hypothetical protein
MVTTDGNISPEEASAFNVILYCDIAISVWPQILDWLGLRLIFPHNVFVHVELFYWNSRYKNNATRFDYDMRCCYLDLMAQSEFDCV